ncbi:DUF3014 domain-containing protein [Idiomarina sp.]|uniref:DUF3014 domain-containing protein n=1 Tax=Idiomarina sp. TaxID=1874361 RepID=UPI0025C35CE8|nr:DUF3014 domain-containing protein [Idiomarina sp.]
MTDNNTEQQQEYADDTANKSRTTVIAVAIVIIAVIIAVVWWWLPADQQTTTEKVAEPANTVSETAVVDEQQATTEPEPEPSPAAVEPDEPEQAAMAEPQPEPEPVQEPQLPALDESTPTVLQTLDTSGVVIQPLKSSQLVRDAVVIIDNLRNGTLVRDRTIVQRPDGRFQVMEIDGELYIDERSYQRYDALVDWFVSIEEQALIKNYELFKPLMQQAYGEIGYPDADFTDAMLEAIDVLLATPVPETLVQVKDDEVMYTYADPAYEGLPPAQKQLLRMGPDNIKRIKQKLRDIRRVFKANL